MGWGCNPFKRQNKILALFTVLVTCVLCRCNRSRPVSMGQLFSTCRPHTTVQTTGIPGRLTQHMYEYVCGVLCHISFIFKGRNSFAERAGTLTEIGGFYEERISRNIQREGTIEIVEEIRPKDFYEP